MPNPTNNKLVDSKTIAALFDMTPRRVQQLTKEEMCIRDSLQGVAACDGQLVAGEVAGAVGQHGHVRGGADFHVLGEDAVGGQGFVGGRGGAEDHQLAVAGGAGRQSHHGAALIGGRGGGLLADGHGEHVSDGLVGNDQAVIADASEVFVQSLAH